jgi:methylase of polypeptide subunit release factors
MIRFFRVRPMFRITCRVQGCAITLDIHERDVFVPNLMSWFTAAHMAVVPGETFCDVGVGSGLHAILAAKLGARRVFGTDINPTALRFARRNARRNGVADRCRFFQGDLLEPLARRGLRVDAVIYNAPQFPGRLVAPDLPERLRDAVDGGPDGGRLNARFIREVGRAVLPRGRVYNPLVAWAAPQRSLAAIREAGFRQRRLAGADIPAWGRGNSTRAWFLKHPGRHVFTFRPGGADGARAWLLELRKDAWPRAGARRPARVEVDFVVRII